GAVEVTPLLPPFAQAVDGAGVSPSAAMPRDGADHHDLRGVCQGNRCGRESAEYIDDLRTPRAFSRPLASRARSRAPSSALGSQRTLRWRKADSFREALSGRWT